MMFGLPPESWYWLFKVMLERSGGSVVIDVENESAREDVVVFMQRADGGGVKFTMARIDERGAGHA